MSPAPQSPAFEVRCPACDVSFPVGTRRCVHCGGPTVAGGDAGLGVQLRAGAAQTGPPAPADEDEVRVTRSRAQRGVALVWFALAVIATLYRACTASG